MTAKNKRQKKIAQHKKYKEFTQIRRLYGNNMSNKGNKYNSMHKYQIQHPKFEWIHHIIYLVYAD